MGKETADARKELISSVFESLKNSEEFEIQTSGGKQVWLFKYAKNGDLLVQPPYSNRFTKVLYPASTLVAIAKGKEYYEMHVKPLPADDYDEEIKPLLVMVRIEAPCLA